MKPALILILASFLSFVAHASTVYKTVVNGKTVYSDSPPVSGTAKEIRMPSYQEPSHPVDTRVPSGTMRGNALRAASTSTQRKVKPDVFIKATNSPVIRVFYDTNGAPEKKAASGFETEIRAAASSWSSGCNVNVEYGGLVGEVPVTGPVITWNGALNEVRHPADGQAEIAGVGNHRGMALNPKFTDNTERTIVHEMGHILGIGHIHDDPASVMSYMGNSSVPNGSDYLSCNLAMKGRYGIAYEPPLDMLPVTMSDKDALEQRSRR